MSARPPVPPKYSMRTWTRIGTALNIVGGLWTIAFVVWVITVAFGTGYPNKLPLMIIWLGAAAVAALSAEFLPASIRIVVIAVAAGSAFGLGTIAGFSVGLLEYPAILPWGLCLLCLALVVPTEVSLFAVTAGGVATVVSVAVILLL